MFRALSMLLFWPLLATANDSLAQDDPLPENGVPGIWAGLGGVPFGCNGRVLDIKKGPDGSIYLAGDFTACNDIEVDRVAAWDPASNEFRALGEPAGVSATVLGMEFDLQGNLIVFSESPMEFAGFGLSYLGIWDGKQWSPLVPGLQFFGEFGQGVSDVAVDPVDGTVLIAGFFTQLRINDGPLLEIAGVARWDGEQLSSVGRGTANGVYDLLFYEGVLYAAGFFPDSESNASSPVSFFDGNDWSMLGDGVGGLVTSLAAGGGRVFAAGDPLVLNGSEFEKLIQWDGVAWAALPSVWSDIPTISNMQFSDGELYVFHGADSIGGVPASAVARWNGSTWSALPFDPKFDDFSPGLLLDGSDIYVGASLLNANTTDGNIDTELALSNRIARFDASESVWLPMGFGSGLSPNGVVEQVLDVEGETWIIGQFTAVGLKRSDERLARWTGQEWLPSPGQESVCDSPFFAGLAKRADGMIFARLECFQDAIDGTQRNGAAMFDSENWLPLADGLSSSARDLAVDESNGDVYYAGSFSESGGQMPVTLNGVGRWNGTNWTSVGDGAEAGTDGSVLDIVANDSLVMIDGFFDFAGTTGVDGLALWDGSAWTVPGDGLQQSAFSNGVSALTFHDGSFFAGGGFTSSGATEVRGVARFDEQAWLPVLGVQGDGVAGRVFGLESTGGSLYAFGRIREAGGYPANGIARWDGTDWSALGLGSSNGFGRRAFIESVSDASNGIWIAGDFAGSNEIVSPGLVRFVPMVDLDLAINAEVSEVTGSTVTYEVVLSNKGEYSLVNSRFEAGWLPSPMTISWTCESISVAAVGCPDQSGSAEIDELIELASNQSIRFQISATFDPLTTSIVAFDAAYSAANAPGATGTTFDSIRLIESLGGTDDVFHDRFESSALIRIDSPDM